MAKNRKNDDSRKPTINDLFNNFEYYINYERDGFYVLARKVKGKKEIVLGMSESPSQLLTHAYMTLNIQTIIYCSDVVSFVIECEQDDLIHDLNTKLSKNLKNFLDNVMNKEKSGFFDDIEEE